MALWSNREDEPFGPHPISTACGTPLEVLTGKPGPIEVKVNPQEVAVQPGPDTPLHKRHLVFALYTGDFRRSIYRTFSVGQNESSVDYRAYDDVREAWRYAGCHSLGLG